LKHNTGDEPRRIFGADTQVNVQKRLLTTIDALVAEFAATAPSTVRMIPTLVNGANPPSVRLPNLMLKNG
jgi:hypothetical protein